MHDLNSEICLDARGNFGWMRARARDVRIVFLSEFWV